MVSYMPVAPQTLDEYNMDRSPQVNYLVLRLVWENFIYTLELISGMGLSQDLETGCPTLLAYM